MDHRANDGVRELTALDGLLERLASLHQPLWGSRDRWEAFCVDGRGVLAETRKALESGDWGWATEQFSGLLKVRDDAHWVFRPGFLKRLGRLFRRVRLASSPNHTIQEEKKYWNRVTPGIEFFLAENKSRVTPGLYIDLLPDVRLNAGAGIGLKKKADNLQLKTILEVEF